MPHLDKSDIETIAQQVIVEEGLEISEVQTFDGVTLPVLAEEAVEKPAVDVEVHGEDGTHLRARIDISPERDPDEIKEGIRELLNKRIER
jgi:hypothetical protein